MSERCGLWLKVADCYETYCARPYDHDGECRASRSELMRRIELLDQESDELSAAVVAMDETYDLWPAAAGGAERDTHG